MLPDPRPYFADLQDPRRETKNKLHKLSAMLMMVFCAVLSGVEDWVGMEEFAAQKEDWFRGFLELPNGIPAHDTLSDVMGRLEPNAFTEAVGRWLQAALPSLSGERICLDGKTLRGSRDGEKVIHLVSAYAAKARLVLMHQAVTEKANEITAIPAVVSMLQLTGALVSSAAIGCQRAIARQSSESGADDRLALKDHHPGWCEDVRRWVESEAAHGRLPAQETVDKEHGRIEIRRYVLSDQLDWLAQKPDWAALAAVGRVESTRIIGDRTSTASRYYLCSFTELARVADAVRGHWGLENGQHWVLDVPFSQEAKRTRKDHSAETLALVRRMALNVIRHHGPSKDSLRRRKLRASLKDDYRAQLLFGSQQT